MNRRHFLQQLIVAGGGMALTGCMPRRPGGGVRPNLVFMTADDMSYNSLGCTGNPLPSISPNLDRLASEGLLIDHCHTASPVCGPARSAWITGTWPQHNGVMGHYNQPPLWFGESPIATSLPELLRSEAGYYTGVICKNPVHKGWDDEADELHTGLGRDPSKYGEITRGFIETALSQDRPFFLHPNSADPHEYWAGQEHETKEWIDAMMAGHPYDTLANGKPYPDPEITYSPEQVPVPAAWPDNAAFRENIHTYYNSVRRLDETVGAVLGAIEATGQTENTLFVFLSDNGIGRAFGKWSLYPLGTRTPMIVRWPGVVEPGRRESRSAVSAIDVAPTFLEAAGVPVPEFMDARSVMDIYRDTGRGDPRQMVFASFDYMNNYPEHDARYSEYVRDLADRCDNYRPMRAINTSTHTYIWNGWSDGENEIPLEMSASQTVRRLLRETGHEHRARFEALRAPEEFYDTASDPGCLVNLIDEPAHAARIAEFRAELLRVMEGIGDQETPNYRADLGLV